MDATAAGDARLSLIDAVLAILLGLFIVAELMLPTNAGVSTGSFLLTPARVVIAIAFLIAISAGVMRRSAPRLPDRRFLVPWAVYLGAVLGSLVIHWTTAGAARFGSLILEGPVLFVLVWGVARHATAARWLEATMIAATIAMAVLTIGLAWIGLRYDEIVRVPFDRLSDLIVTVRFGLIRQTGAFDAPLFYATWLLTVSALVLPRIADSVGLRRALWALGWLGLAAAILLTTSRLALAGLPLVVAAFLALRVSIQRAAAAATIGVLAAAMLFTLPGNFLLVGTPSAPIASGRPSGSQALNGTSGPASSGGPASTAPFPSPSVTPPVIDSTEGSNQARIEAISATIQSLRESPLLGWGPLSGRATAERILGHQNAIDDAYLVIAIESGLIGLVGFLLILAAVMSAAAARRGDGVSTGRLVGLSAFLVMSVVAATFSVTQLYAAFWFLAAITIAAPSRTGRGLPAIRGPVWPPRISKDSVEPASDLPSAGR
jgi:hypothetical protein